MLIPKYPDTGITIFSVMSALAQQYKAINLSQGFPDFSIDEKLTKILAKTVQQGAYNQYAPMPGNVHLREIIAQNIQLTQNININPEQEITITPGATYGLYAALSAIIQPLDEVIVLEPAYDSYIPAIQMHGGIPVSVALNENDFSVDWEAVAQHISPKTKAIFINNPHNPCGNVWAETDIEQLAVLVEKYNLYVVADEVYEHLVFGGQKHKSVLAHPVLRKRSFAVYSFGKVLHATGWKIGYVVADASLTNAFRKLHQFIGFSVNSVMQAAIAEYISDFKNITLQAQRVEEQRNLFLRLIQGTPFRVLNESEGSYFQLVSYAHLSDVDDKTFAEWLTKEVGVATIPLSPFYQNRKDDKLLRICFAKNTETIEQAIAKLQTVNTKIPILN